MVRISQASNILIAPSIKLGCTVLIEFIPFGMTGSLAFPIPEKIGPTAGITEEGLMQASGWSGESHTRSRLSSIKISYPMKPRDVRKRRKGPTSTQSRSLKGRHGRLSRPKLLFQAMYIRPPSSVGEYRSNLYYYPLLSIKTKVPSCSSPSSPLSASPCMVSRTWQNCRSEELL